MTRTPVRDPLQAVGTTLPPVPADLAGWEWEADRYTNGSVVRLVNAANDAATDWPPPMDAAAMIGDARAIAAGGTAVVAEMTEPPTTRLTPQMQRHVDRTLAADRKGGEALWEKACAVADARADAEHGEWGTYLEATGQNERAAQRLVSIAERGRIEARFRDAIISGFLSFSVAAITTQADDQLLDQLLTAPTPPTQREALAGRNPTSMSGFSNVVPPTPPATPPAGLDAGRNPTSMSGFSDVVPPTPPATPVVAVEALANPAALPDFSPPDAPARSAACSHCGDSLLFLDNYCMSCHSLIKAQHDPSGSAQMRRRLLSDN